MTSYMMSHHEEDLVKQMCLKDWVAQMFTSWHSCNDRCVTYKMHYTYVTGQEMRDLCPPPWEDCLVK